jgi:AcrR family transcriptional regulator
MATLRIRKSAEERKSEIVDAALRLAGEIGPDRMTTEALAREVGLSQSGIFRHFPTKEAIWESIGKHIGALLQAKTSLTRKRNASPADELRDYVVSHLAFVEATPAIPAILFSRELHAENDKLRQFFAGLIASRHEYISKLIAAGIEAEDFRKSINPDDAAYLVLALIQGLAMRWSLNARSFDLAEEGRRLLDLQLEGFKIPDGKIKS